MGRQILAVAGLAGVILLGGCAAAGPMTFPSSAPSSAFSPVAPFGGRPLSSLGLTNAVADQIWLPVGTTLTYTADQPNLVIAVGLADQADTVQDFLASSLTGLGWTITDQADGGLLFEMGPWEWWLKQGSQAPP